MRHVSRAAAMAAGLLILAACGSNTEEQAASGAMGGGPAGARVVQGNIGFANGVVHGIDKVLLPASLSPGADG